MPTTLTFKGDKKSKTNKKRKLAKAEEEDGAVVALSADAAVEDDDSWVSADSPSDLAGPVIIVLPSEPVSCIAADAQGTVFASGIENMVGANPGSAEPHDVRQVWVAQRIAGTAEGMISLKGSGGK